MAEALLDRIHLDLQTAGDTVLARELLDLFAEQCRELLPRILDEGLSTTERADLAHTLKGSALGVGADRVAVRASETETRLRSGEAIQTETLAAAVEATLAALADD